MARKKPLTVEWSVWRRGGWHLVLGWGIGLILCGCTQALFPSLPGDRPRVVATSTILTDLTQRIGGNRIHLIGLLKPGTDPHLYEPVPHDSRSLEQAALILYNGYNLEPGIIRLMESTGGNARKLAVGEVVTPLTLQRKQSQPDPHVWGDVGNVMTMTGVIRDALIELDPQQSIFFKQNTDQLNSELTRLHHWIKDQINTIPRSQRRLVTTHDAFQYYAHAYGLEVLGTLIGISTEEQPSAQTLKELVNAIRSAQIPVIFAETTINPRLITTVAQESGARLARRRLYSDSIGAPTSDASSYVQMMTANTRAIVEDLGGYFHPFPVNKIQ